MIESGHILNLSVLLMGLGLAALYLKGGAGAAVSTALFRAAVIAGLIYIGRRYWLAWPMTPMFLSTAALPPVLALAAWLSVRPVSGDLRLFILRRALGLCFLIGAASALFPKDFYLPFLKTTSVFSHLHLLLAVLGKAALVTAGLWAWASLRFSGGGHNLRFQNWPPGRSGVRRFLSQPAAARHGPERFGHRPEIQSS